MPADNLLYINRHGKNLSECEQFPKRDFAQAWNEAKVPSERVTA